MADTGTPPVIPDEFKQYNSYVDGPKWQGRFTAIWCSVMGLSILIFLVSRQMTWNRLGSFWGLQEEWYPQKAIAKAVAPGKEKTSAARPWNKFSSFFLWSPPGIGLNLGQILVVVIYTAVVIVCVVTQAPLVENSNRAGFIALAQLPPVFLFSCKTIPSLIGLGYEKINYLHRWSGRTLFLAAAIHGSLWIQNHLKWEQPIIGEEKETYGIAAFGTLCIIVLTSLRVVRRWAYEFFFGVHILAFPTFFIIICYHTPYALPWIFPPLAFYGFDILMRMVRYRIKDATIEAVDNAMTLIHIPHLTSGWAPGQHVRLRIFGVPGRAMESHPLTVLSAPNSTTCLKERGITLGARVKGDWTKALNQYADVQTAASEKELPQVPTYVLIDGPYGSMNLADSLAMHDNVVMIAGGSGATFTLGLLDDLVGRPDKKTQRIEWIWCVRGFGQINWFSRYLSQISSAAVSKGLDLRITVYVTCLCDPEALPHIDNCDVRIGGRPDLTALLREVSMGGNGKDIEKARQRRETLGVCASGPESMTRDASNAVAKVNMQGTGGNIMLHTEAFSI